MTSLVVALGLVAALGFAVLLLARWAARAGRAEAEAETNRRMAEHAETQGRIMAEHRDPERTSERLRDGSF